MPSRPQPRHSSFRDNSLTLAFVALFLVCLVGQVATGFAVARGQSAASHADTGGVWGYVRGGTFLESGLVNWQAAVLQLATLILLGKYLLQRGAPHSRKADEEPTDPHAPVQHAHPVHQATADPRSATGSGSWLHRNSLSVAFWTLFLLAFIAHFLSGRSAFNAVRATQGLAPISSHSFFASSTFWFANFQTWEAEFMAIVLYLLLSIYLRQQGSPESKPVDASDSDTADANH